MRRTSQLAIAVVALVLGIATVSLFMLYQRQTTSLHASQAAEQATRDQFAQATTAISEIQDSLATILPEGERLPTNSQSFTNERAMGGPSSGEILERISTLRAGLKRGMDRIAKLEADLEKSGIRTASLQKMVAGLRRTVKAKEAELTAMSAQLTDVKDTLRVHDEILVDRQRELATVFVVQGHKSDLIKSGVVEARGGILGLGKTLRPSARIPETLMSTLNTDEESVVHLDAAKAQVVSAQPLSSYEMLLVDGKVELHILDPAEFRKVRQLVIVTA